MKWITTYVVIAGLAAGTGCCLAGRMAREEELSSEDQALRERNQVYGFMSRLTSSDVKIRNRADLDFKDLNNPSAQLLVHLLIDAFHAGDADVRCRVVAQLARIGPRASPAVPLLVEQSRNANNDIRGRAAFALEKIGPAAREAIPALVAALQDPRSGGPRMAAESAPQTVGDWARVALDKVERKSAPPGADGGG
jgi:hypothetical protein